jgi:predicted nucleic acid-binding protein
MLHISIQLTHTHWLNEARRSSHRLSRWDSVLAYAHISGSSGIEVVFRDGRKHRQMLLHVG